MKRNILIILLFFILLTGAAICSPKIIVLTVDGAISPATASYIKNGIEEAEKKDAAALIIKLNTPGGLLEATREIVSSILTSKIPIIVYVAPPGARAGSAGVFITLSANIAVMAPGTNIGAAHPVGMGGESGDSTNTMYEKVTNDASAFIRAIAQRRHRNVDWAERTVRESISATENEALKLGAIDFIAPTVDSLLREADGMIVETSSATITLNTQNADVEELEMDWRQKLLSVLSDPNIAYLFLLLGIYGIFFELYNPGSVFPGVVGGISIILAAYSLQMLPINFAGLALILLAIVLFIIEVKVTSYGILTIGGVVAFLLGSLLLIDSPFEFMQISLSIIITAAVLTALFFLIIVGLGLKAQTRKRSSGKEGMLDETGDAVTDISPQKPGNVKVHGEIWKAVSDQNISAGSLIVVTSVESLVLRVKSKD